MNPADLIDTRYAPALPAPLWFIQFFKVLGFSLHAVPMNLWYAGIPLAAVAFAFGSPYLKRLSGRLMLQMPFIIAMGVNLGIVPLLFIQVAYSKVFYPATVLMGWFWFSVILLLIPAYYGVYLYVIGMRRGGPLPAWRQAFGWVAALLFVCIGFLFANAMSLSTNVEGWSRLWAEQQYHGAAMGTRLNLYDPTLVPRWLMFFGIAMMTLAAWASLDLGWFSGKDSAEYRRWALNSILVLATVALIWAAVFGAWYVFGTWRPAVRDRMLRMPLLLHTLLTGASPGLTWLLILLAWRRGAMSRAWAALIGVAQFGVIGINAVSRQMVQNIELTPYYDVTKRAIATELAPLVIFLVLFVAGLALVAWMLWQVIKLPASEAA